MFDPGIVAGELPAREAAAAAYDALLGPAGDWGAPDPVRAAMAAWRFDDAETEISAAAAWLDQRDAMFASLGDLGLTAPARLRDQYRAAGGGDAAQAELQAELAVVDAYRDASDRLAAWDRPLLARVGLVGGTDPSTVLAQAASSFAQGDLRGAADAIDRATATIDRAALDGAVRLASLGAILVALVIGLVVVLRRRRLSGYTPAR